MSQETQQQPAPPEPGAKKTAGRSLPEPEIRLVVSSSPHIHARTTIESQMYLVVLALMPALAWGMYVFGLPALLVTLQAVIWCLIFEALCLKAFKPKDLFTDQLKDGSAIVAGILLAFNLPSSAPWWMIAIGALVAMFLGKHVFGGIGQNPFNPALVGRIFLLIAFPVEMTNWPEAGQGLMKLTAADTLTQATPLGVLKTDGLSQAMQIGLERIFLGQAGGCIGEVSVIALLLGATLLLWRGVITWHIPVSFLGTVVVFSGVFKLMHPEVYAGPMFQLFSGGLILGAFYMATDMVSSPLAGRGMLIFGAGCGLLTYVIRTWGGYPEGVAFAILIMNAFVPLIDRYCLPRRFGADSHYHHSAVHAHGRSR